MRTSPPINECLKEYCTFPAVADWQDQEWARQLHAWSERMSAAFGLDIATPVILIKRTRSHAAEAYSSERNSLGLLHELTLNRKRLNQPLAWVLAGLLRGLLREWQHLHGQVGLDKRHYNRQLRCLRPAFCSGCKSSVPFKRDEFRSHDLAGRIVAA